MRNWVGVIGIAAVVMASCGGGHGTGEQTSLAPVSAGITKAAVASVPQRVELYGSVEAGRTAAVSSRVMATVTAVHVRAGDTVKAGQVLVEIDPQTAQGQEGQAKGALAQADAALTLAERNYERFRALAADGAASELELDMARMQYEQAKGAVEQGRGAVEAAASVARESRVVSPFAGRVAAKLVEVGDLAAPGRPLVMVESATGVKLALSVPESVATVTGLKPGMVIPARIDALPGRGEIAGKIIEMTPGSDPMSHSFTVKVELGGAEVPTGLAGRAWVQVGERSAVAVPRAALLRQGGVTMVAVRDGEGKARSRVVSVGGPMPNDLVEILAGLSGGEDVLVGLAAVPADGAPVEVRP
ncbi:MAG: efflux RND transporter periplasmic adaptor subunit [Acidobacteriota bacterium]